MKASKIWDYELRVIRDSNDPEVDLNQTRFLLLLPVTLTEAPGLHVWAGDLVEDAEAATYVVLSGGRLLHTRINSRAYAIPKRPLRRVCHTQEMSDDECASLGLPADWRCRKPLIAGRSPGTS